MMFVGCIAVVVAFLLFVYNIFVDNNAGKNSSEILSVLDMESITVNDEYVADYIVNPNMNMPKKVINSKEFVGEIDIPCVNIKLPVMARWSEEDSKTAPCVYNGTPYLNNIIIAGHNYKSQFGPIDNLKSGDKVSFKDMDGNIFNYEVMYTEIIDGHSTDEMLAGEWDLTIFTCNYSGSARITVRCKMV